MASIEVKVGQIWEDCDSRRKPRPDTTMETTPRRIKILRIIDGKAHVQNSSGQGVITKIRLDRFKPTSTGYKLVQDII